MAAQTVRCGPGADVETLDRDCIAETSKMGRVFSSTTNTGAEASEVSPAREEHVKKERSNLRAEIDTSAPFESVKEAVSRFGGIGFWKPHSDKLSQPAEHDFAKVDVVKVEEEAVRLEKYLIVKERETLDVLKELEATKLIVEELKSKLQKETSQVDATLKVNSDNRNEGPALEIAEEGNCENLKGRHHSSVSGISLYPSSAPGLILRELKRAKLNLTRTTNDLADIRATVESYNKKLERERISLEKTRERLTLNYSKISNLEEELNQTRVKLQLVKGKTDCPVDFPRELQKSCYEADRFKKMGEAAKLEVSRAMSEIEEIKSMIKTAEIQLVAAKKMKQAARAAEAVALAEIKALSNSKRTSGGFLSRPEGVTLSIEEYSSLIHDAQEAEEALRNRVVNAMLQVEDANASKMEILKMVEEATAEVNSNRKLLEEALGRVEAADRGKLAVEEAMRKWRSKHGQRKHLVHNSTKFKNSYPSQLRKGPRLLDVNGLSLANDDESKRVLRPTLSIGQILSQKLLLTQEYGSGMQAEKGTIKRKVSLGQMLCKPDGSLPSDRRAEKENGNKQFPAKRKKFGFARFSLLTTKQSKKKKKQIPNLRSRGL